MREFYDIQKLRISTDNRLKRMPESEVLASASTDFDKNEAILQKKIKPELKNYPIYRRFLAGITGCGPLLSGCLISEIGKTHKNGQGIAAFPNPSKIIKYAGIGPREIYSNHKFNWFLKMSFLGEQKLVDQFIMHRHPFGYPRYLELKESMRIKHPEKLIINGKTRFSDAHISNMAKKEVANIFLTNLWSKWRTLEGLPVINIYAQDVLGHTNIVKNPDVWIDKEEKLID